MRRSFWWAAMVGLGCLVGTSTLWGQDEGEGRRERGGFDRGGFGRDRGEGSERRFDPTEILRRIDRNGDGTIDPDEVSERGRRFVADAAARAGLDPTKPLSVEKLAIGMGAPASSTPPTTPPTTTTPTTPTTPPAETTPAKTAVPSATVLTAPLIPGFGVASTLTPPPGFDVPLSKGNRFQRPLEERFEKAVIDRVNDLFKQMDKNKDNMIEYAGDEGKENRWQGDPKVSDLNNDGKFDREELCIRIAKLMGSKERTPEGSSSRSSGGSSSTSSSADDARAKYRKYAEGMLKQNDANGNGTLEKEEWSKMRGDNAKADVNGDGVITLDELTDRLASYSSESGSSGGDSGSSEGSRRGGWGSRGSGERGPGGSRDSASGSSGNKSLRLLTATERLPKGLPTWFTRNDGDGDGQISMAEYSTVWNDTTAAEFAKYDLNSDGTITPDECLAGEKEKLARKN